MHKLFQSTHGYISSTFRNHFNNSKFLSPISRFHDHSENPAPNPKLNFVLGEGKGLQLSKPENGVCRSESETESDEYRSVQILHPWPEWVDLMEFLLKRGYFEGDGNPFRNGELGHREAKWIRTACLNFSRDQYDLIRFLSRKDIQVIAGCGCPSLDRKVVNSGKRLRAHVAVNEGDICSSCNLRGECERAYVKAREEEGTQTVDVMRFLLTYGLDPITSTVENKPCLSKTLTESVRSLLKQIVDYSMQIMDFHLPQPTSKNVPPLSNHSSSQGNGRVNVPMKQGDWHCPKCNFLNFAKKFKCLRCDGLYQERLKQLREDQDHLPLKKGDWICDKCNFLNFAKNTKCMQCKENPPKRQLNPGEWECPSCNYINFRRNMVCLKCDHRRPKAANSSKICSENEGHRGNNRLRTFQGDLTCVNVQKSSWRQGQNQNNGANMWRSVEESEEHGYLNSRNEASDFVDFPIAGGSWDAEKIDRWKSEMIERSKGEAKRDELETASTQRRLEFPNYADDEEMAEWFGPGKSERNSLVRGPQIFQD